MTTVIENEVVKLGFDAAEFHREVRKFLVQLNSLREAINFDSAIENFRKINPAIQNVNFEHMESGIASISKKLSVMGVIAATVISNITNRIVNAIGNAVQNVLIRPVRDGLAEYETQMGSIQTILANTKAKGTDLEDVNEALDELNEYADLTIYNFSQMTDSIGKFTAAGVELDQSVGAIKGIANVAALSGSNTVQASTAMYQLSQAIASGTVRLQDWMSVENAGMGGEVFRNALIETAKAHGISVDAMIAKNGSFRNSLQEGWLSSEVMLDTLNAFTGDLSVAQLEMIGYTTEQIEHIQEMAATALGAATEIKTATQLADTLFEAIGSGWAQSWRIIIGDFQEAKDLFSQIGGFLSGIIDEQADNRNNQLSFWAAAGGRQSLIDSFIQSMTLVFNILEKTKEGIRDVW